MDHDALRTFARRTADRSVVTFSKTPVGVALLLTDGTVVTGARVESASYPLTIPALQAAWARARAAGRSDIVAVAASRPLAPAELTFLSADTRRRWREVDGEIAAVDGIALHAPTVSLSGLQEASGDGFAAALAAAKRAHAPVSGFPVGCVIETARGWVAGCNVEHAADWTRGLCAERVALAAAIAEGAGEITRIWLACPKAPGATPCGGCRQLLSEHAPGAEVHIWNGDDAPLLTSPGDLLPGAFDASRLAA